MFQQNAGWTLAVVDPRVPVAEARERVAELREWMEWRGQRYWWIGVASASTLVCALLIWGAVAALDGSGTIPAMLVLISVSLGLCLFGIPAQLAWRRILSPPQRPAEIVVRSGVDMRLWELVRHLNSYRTVDADHGDAVRGLLWALAHTTPADTDLIDELANRFGGWSEHEAALLRSAAARVWARRVRP